MIIPIFIPHEGCPNDCAFCNQRTISGNNAAPTINQARNVIKEHLATMNGKADQIAFFGGSFTGIEKEKQNEYLSLAYEFVKGGKVNSIRLSTRPDYIDADTVKRLLSYGVKNIELGAQSMDDEVLKASKRGHSRIDVEKASRIITDSGATLGLQMMTGLPNDSKDKCLYTAKCFKELGAKETRIYPTVVLKGTHLAKMYEMGEYQPQSIDDAVDVCALLYRYFTDNDITILRMGLPDSISLKENYIKGAYHPSLGELIVSRDIRNQIEKQLNGKTDIIIRVNPRYISKVNGNRRCNILYFKEKGININLIVDSDTQKFKVEF